MKKHVTSSALNGLIGKAVIVALLLAGIGRPFGGAEADDTPAYVLTPSTAGGCGVPVVEGWEFTANSSIEATALGIFDGNLGGAGLVGTHEVKLFSLTGDVLATATVPPGTATTLVGGSRFVAITPVTLSAGSSYVLAAAYCFNPTSGDDQVAFGNASQTFDSAITFVQGRRQAFVASLVFPPPGIASFGPNLLFRPAGEVCNATVPTDYATIQQAIDAAPNPGPWSICVLDGAYAQSVSVSGKNGAAVDASQTIRIRSVNPLGAVLNPSTLTGAARQHAFKIELSRFISIEGFKLTGATKEAVFVSGGALTNANISVIGNEITGNGGPSTNGGIYIGRENPGTLVDLNSIRHNHRNGISIEADAAGNTTNSAKVISNNLVCGQGFNGVWVGRTVADVITLSGNRIHCNGSATGTTGGRTGVLRQTVAPAAGPGLRQLIVLNENELCNNRIADIGSVAQTLGPASNDADNVTSSGGEESQCVSPGCGGAIAGSCEIMDCAVLCP